jgi:hypothetical protein
VEGGGEPPSLREGSPLLAVVASMKVSRLGAHVYVPRKEVDLSLVVSNVTMLGDESFVFNANKCL